MRQEKERAQAAAAAARNRLQHAHSNSSQHHYTAVTTAHKRKREEEREAATSTKSKKKKMISTTSTKESKKDTKLYCICKTPYDETKYEAQLSSTFADLVCTFMLCFSVKVLHWLWLMYQLVSWGMCRHHREEGQEDGRLHLCRV